MSDIIVRGLEPPQKCEHGKCNFACSAAYNTGLICIALNAYVPGGDIPDYCPVHILPMHGDLIDRDTLLHGEGLYMISLSRIGLDVDEIMRAKAIVPGDGKEFAWKNDRLKVD